MVPEEYLTIKELALRLKLTPKTIRNKMALGIFQRGVHYYVPNGMKPRFKWSAVVAYLENGQDKRSPNEGDLIPMPRNYRFRGSCTK